jgi:hypothetical protein
MDILSFDCNSSMITKDLRKTLKSRSVSNIQYRFLSLQSMPALQHSTELIKGCLESGTGRSGKRNLKCIIHSLQSVQAYIRLTGSHKFCFSDFKLSPPRKMAGLIKIKDEFDVNFQLVLRGILSDRYV